jgi:solute carrier family 8 (sodium/calcium exchanger)
MVNYHPGVLAIFYFLLLIYLFFGVAIIADKFMEAIEKLTSIKTEVKIEDEQGNVKTKMVPFWNATVANLTLMALGSSAPEIILAVLDTLQGLGECPGELGAATIVGSAAFNLLVISGVCVYGVKPDEKIAKE